MRGVKEETPTPRPPAAIFRSAAERRVWIKGQLELRGESFATIARELGVSRQAVRLALDQKRPRMERAIAAKLGLAPEELWPERYTGAQQFKPRRKVAQ